MKTYVIMIAQKFPAGHPRAGQPTNFAKRIRTREDVGGIGIGLYKIHTIRENFPLWQKRFAEIEAGKACLSLRIWEGTPYRSKQIELEKLTAKDGIGLQELKLIPPKNEHMRFYTTHVDGRYIYSPIIANGDGLLLPDWDAWFEHHDTKEPLAIIHFTNYRY